MQLTSFEYLLFLPIVFGVYWLCGRLKNGLFLQNLAIVVASYVFYGWVDPKLCVLIVLTSLSTFASGLLMSGSHRKFALLFAILFNLLILCYFKYFNFFIQSFSDAFALLGVSMDIPTSKILLPAGISFYTFTSLSYSIDVYRGDTKPVPLSGAVSYFAYVCFFPQLLAGPIGRSTTTLAQFQIKHCFDYETAVIGLRQMLWGFFKKIVIADCYAEFVNNVWINYSSQSSSTLLLAAILYSVQIYCDFSGYSDIAIGSAKLFNINLGRNFESPYFSRNIAEFWRRWHISLTSWFRDYIYIPLGGSRTTKAKHIRNTIIVFLVSGFWHGANWTFIFWGLYHAILFIPLLLLKKQKFNTPVVASNGILPSAKEFCQILLTFALVTVGWVFFRADTISQAFHYLALMCDFEVFQAIPKFFTQPGIRLISFLTIFTFGIEWLNRKNVSPIAIVSSYNRPVRLAFYLFLAFCIFWFYNDVDAFIYAQF